MGADDLIAGEKGRPGAAAPRSEMQSPKVVDFTAASLTLTNGARSRARDRLVDRAVLHTDKNREYYEDNAREYAIRKMRRGWLKDVTRMATFLEDQRDGIDTRCPGIAPELLDDRLSILDRAQAVWCIETSMFLDNLREAVAGLIEKEFPNEDGKAVAKSVREGSSWISWPRVKQGASPDP